MNKILLFTLATIFIISCQNKAIDDPIEDDYLKQNHEYLRKMVLCRCIENLDSNLSKKDYSSSIYFERCSYGPDISLKIDSVIKIYKPTFRSYANHSLAIGECIEFYESDTLKKEISKLDYYLAKE